MNKRYWMQLFFMAILGLVLAACSPSAGQGTATRETEEQVAVVTPTAGVPDATQAPPTATHTPLPAPASPTATTAPQVVAATATPVPICTVRAGLLNLRSGPGTVFEPPLTTLPQGTQLEPLGFSAVGFPENDWIEVRVRQSGQVGWVSASPQFVACNVDPTSLPPATPPPTPAAASRVLLAFVPVDGGGGDVLNLRNDHPIKDGRNVTLPGFAQSEVTEPMVFGERVVFQVEVFDKNVGQADGDGIQQVEFTIRDGNEVVHERTERNAGYCAFGGGEPDCTVWAFYEHGKSWPKGQAVREDVFYGVEIHIVANSGETVDWMWSFKVDLP